jgi:hypothetical protein
MIKKLLTLVTAMVIAVSAAAADKTFTFLIPWGGGTNDQNIAELLTPGLKQSGWDTSIVLYNGNCAAMVQDLKNTKKPTIAVWANRDHLLAPDHECYLVPPTAQNMISIWYYAPDYLCAVGKTPPEAIFTTPGTYRISVQAFPGTLNWVTDAIRAASPGTVKTVIYTGSGAQIRGAAAQETEYVLGTSGKVIERNGQAVCTHNTGPTELLGTRPLGEINQSVMNYYMMVYAASKNISANLQSDLRADMARLLQTQPLQDYFKTRQFMTKISTASTDEQVNFLSKSIKK